MADGFRWKPVLRADQCGSAKEVLCLRPWLQDGWPSFRLAISLYPPSDIYSPLLAHLNITTFISYSLAHIFTPGSGPFSVCMHCLRVSWALDLRARSSHYLCSPLHHCISSHLTVRAIHHIFFILSTVRFTSSSLIPRGDPPHFITWRVVMSFPLSITRTLIQGSSVWEGHLIRLSLWYIDIWGHVYSFLIPSLGLLCMRSDHVQFSYML